MKEDESSQPEVRFRPELKNRSKEEILEELRQSFESKAINGKVNLLLWASDRLSDDNTPVQAKEALNDFFHWAINPEVLSDQGLELLRQLTKPDEEVETDEEEEK